MRLASSIRKSKTSLERAACGVARYLFSSKSGAIPLGFPDTTQDVVLFAEKAPGSDAAVRALRELGFNLSAPEAAESVRGKDRKSVV